MTKKVSTKELPKNQTTLNVVVNKENVTKKSNS